jgi:hypothetical protein
MRQGVIETIARETRSDKPCKTMPAGRPCRSRPARSGADRNAQALTQGRLFVNGHRLTLHFRGRVKAVAVPY